MKSEYLAEVKVVMIPNYAIGLFLYYILYNRLKSMVSIEPILKELLIQANGRSVPRE